MTAPISTISGDERQLIKEILTPVIRALLHEGEFEGCAISTEPNGDRIAWITAVGEEFQLLLDYTGSDETIAEVRERVFSELQDQISESDFGWGEWRGREGLPSGGPD